MPLITRHIRAAQIAARRPESRADMLSGVTWPEIGDIRNRVLPNIARELLPQGWLAAVLPGQCGYPVDPNSNPWTPLPSTYEPTTWPSSLTPTAEVEVAPGTSMVVKVPPWSVNPWKTPVLLV